MNSIAIVKVKEDYEGIAEGYDSCFEEINRFIRRPEINIKGIDYQLEFFLCCDYKVPM